MGYFLNFTASKKKNYGIRLFVLPFLTDRFFNPVRFRWTELPPNFRIGQVWRSHRQAHWIFLQWRLRNQSSKIILRYPFKLCLMHSIWDVCMKHLPIICLYSPVLWTCDEDHLYIASLPSFALFKVWRQAIIDVCT